MTAFINALQLKYCLSCYHSPIEFCNQLNLKLIALALFRTTSRS